MNFQKSSFSAQGNSCVEVDRQNHVVQVRDSKNKTGDGKVLEFSATDWELNVLIPIKRSAFDWKTFSPLIFNDKEREAFVLGVRNDEFELPKVTV